MWAFDRASGDIVAANAAACRLYGFTRDELLACSVDDVCRSPLGSLLRVDLLVSPQDETVWHRRRDRSTFQTEISMIANASSDGSTATVLVHPLILANGGDAILTSALPLLAPDGDVQGGPFPSLRPRREAAESEDLLGAARRGSS
jgi:PAS domain-containing protein